MLEVLDLHKRYGDVVALDGCTFAVRPGRMLGFLGRNGAGKTTAMRAIFGLLRPDGGEVRWRGRPLTPAALLRFGYMPEERGLYPKMRVAEQLAYFGRLQGMPPARAQAAATAWLDELGLADRAGSRLEELSQGNQQRVQLAVALLHDPEALVLDEPFNGLDPVAAETMARVLRERAAAGAAVVFSSHQLEVVEHLCEDVAVIDRGRTALVGEVAALKRASAERVVEVDAAVADLAALRALEGVLDARSVGGRHVLRVRREVDVHELLGVLAGGGALEHLVYTTPSLTDLFREAVGS